MVSLWRRDFGPDNSRDVVGVPSGNYRITLRASGEPSYQDAWEMSCRMGEIVGFATPYIWEHWKETRARLVGRVPEFVTYGEWGAIENVAPEWVADPSELRQKKER
ncbi:hypothetical protein LZC95_14245 [Pendulispora brunnea]|uniref:Uncharacterized protein n=1 Tax=Pendulispora brunnea TaxID=2905690 RepID=A0ABZ2KKZ2_9BACT